MVILASQDGNPLAFKVRANKSYDEKRVLQLLAQDSQYAFTQLFDRYRSKIFSIALRYLKSRDLAEETLQEVFVKVWIKRKDLPRILQFEAYLFTMTRNHIFDGIKAVAEETTALKEYSYTLEQINGSDQPILEKQYEELLNRIIEGLPPQQKQVFRLAKIEGLSYQAIAAQLNISRFTVKNHMAKALQSIRLELKHHIPSIVSVPVILTIFEF